MMEPWQTPLNKAPNKGGKKEQKKGPQVRAKRREPKGAHIIALCEHNKLMELRAGSVETSSVCQITMEIFPF
jgi:hypothetical protein